MKGGSAMYTASAIAAPRVSAQLAHEWGEALWTAPDLADGAFQSALRTAALTGLILGRL